MADRPIKIALTVEETLLALGIGRTLFYQEVASGRLKIVKVGRRTLVPIAEIRAWLQNLQAAQDQ